MKTCKRIAVVILSVALCLMFSGCDFPTIGVGDIQNPTDTVVAFLESVCDGDFKGADKCLEGCSISMESGDCGAFASRLLEYLQQSYSYKIVGEAETDGMSAFQRVEFTYLKPDLLLDDLSAKTTELGSSYIVKNDKKYTVLENGVCSLTDEGAELVSIEALESIMANPEKYYSTDVFEIEMTYSKASWRILLSDELFEAIVGKYSVAEQ